MSKYIRWAVQHAIARTLAERLFERSNCEVKSAQGLFATLDDHSSMQEPSFCITPSGSNAEIVDVRYRGRGSLYTSLDRKRLPLWRQWRKSYPLTIMVVSPREPYFQAIPGSYIVGNSVPTSYADPLEIVRWGIRWDVLDACVCVLQEFLPEKEDEPDG
jgi:hypothetical protein